MALSTLDIFKIGIGPSSSHTMGPMRAARAFADELSQSGKMESVESVTVELYGSLALTGHGHATDRAIVLGLSGYRPESVDSDVSGALPEQVAAAKKLRLLGIHAIAFDPEECLVFLRDSVLPRHANGMRFLAIDCEAKVILTVDFYSIGGGFVVRGDEVVETDASIGLPYPFRSGAELLELCAKTRLSIAELMVANEHHLRTAEGFDASLREVWSVMLECVERGFRSEGRLPGPLGVRRRAPALFRSLSVDRADPDLVQWANAAAMAVNEENAAGGRVVTAPTNGSAGVIPAVIYYLMRSRPEFGWQEVRDFLLAAAAVGILYKSNASISGAEMGCQGEIGVSCSMAAAGLVQALGGTVAQVENAAEIAMEHCLGLTCDPVGGLVQIPCIERNAMGAVKAINAARLACSGDGTHQVSLDQVIETMRQTGIDMSTKYKETSLGGLALNAIRC